ncbi:MAG: hypothetical protein P1S46_04595 [bacterium]|nr:hypothetical protein [bacterium]MDT8396676.1 hypothetical protein [bacterium]
MVPSGIFVRTGFDGLADLIVQRLSDHGPFNLRIDYPGGKEPADGMVRVGISRWSGKWCRLEVEGAQEGVDLLLEALVAHDPLDEVLTSHFKPEGEEYSYILYRDGKVMEKFDSRGPGIESVHFISELRRVPLQTLMSASDFMILSMCEHGIHRDGEHEEAEAVFIDLTLPGKLTFLQSLLGAVSRR